MSFCSQRKLEPVFRNHILTASYDLRNMSIFCIFWSFLSRIISIFMPSGWPSDEKGSPLQSRFLVNPKCTDPKTTDQIVRNSMGQVFFLLFFSPLVWRNKGLGLHFTLSCNFKNTLITTRTKKAFLKTSKNSLTHRLCHKDWLTVTYAQWKILSVNSQSYSA